MFTRKVIVSVSAALLTEILLWGGVMTIPITAISFLTVVVVCDLKN
jgi:hypothetical protein